jgi:hypothetical protein
MTCVAYRMEQQPPFYYVTARAVQYQAYEPSMRLIYLVRSIPVPPPEKARVLKPQVIHVHREDGAAEFAAQKQDWKCSDEKHRYIPCGGPEEAGVGS